MFTVTTLQNTQMHSRLLHIVKKAGTYSLLLPPGFNGLKKPRVKFTDEASFLLSDLLVSFSSYSHPISISF
jgi:hypothetical protein